MCQCESHFSMEGPLTKGRVASAIDPVARRFGLGTADIEWTRHAGLITKVCLQCQRVVNDGDWEAALRQAQSPLPVEMLLLQLGAELAGLAGAAGYTQPPFGHYQALLKRYALTNFETVWRVRSMC